MASTYTSRFKLEKMETGANANTWVLEPTIT